MLSGLFGNKNVEKILFFLFVNRKCYGTQLHRLLNVPLTPIQKGLLRLERGGVIMSDYAGKTRIYQFNPAFPLLPELEQLLKKGYTLLHIHEKKSFYMGSDTPLPSQRKGENKHRTLLEFWKKLSSVTQLTFHATSKSTQNLGKQDLEKQDLGWQDLKEQDLEGQDLGWNGKGKGEVIVIKNTPNSLIFQEKGTWKGREREEVTFTNTFRWTLDQKAGVISLEHLRRGPNHPVFLFHLAPSSNNSLFSIDSHLCGEDTYFGKVHIDPHSLHLHWRIIGPKKNADIDSHYF